MRPYPELIERVCEIPGVERLTAWTLISEIGLDMERFLSSGHLASWCGLCPGNADSAGKRHSGKTNKGNTICPSSGPYRSQKEFLSHILLPRQPASRKEKAAITVAHQILTIVYSMIRSGAPYREQGADTSTAFIPCVLQTRLAAAWNASFWAHLEPKYAPETS